MIEARVGQRLRDGEQDVAGAAELQDHVAVGDRAGHEGRGDEIGAAGHDRRALLQAGGRGGRSRDLADHLLRGTDRRQPIRCDPGQRDQLGIEAAGRNIDQPGLERPVLLDAARAREPPGDVVVGAEHRRDPREHLRLVALDPAQLRRHQLLIDAAAGAAKEVGRRRWRASWPRFRRWRAHRSAACRGGAGGPPHPAARPPAACR